MFVYVVENAPKNYFLCLVLNVKTYFHKPNHHSHHHKPRHHQPPHNQLTLKNLNQNPLISKSKSKLIYQNPQPTTIETHKPPQPPIHHPQSTTINARTHPQPTSIETYKSPQPLILQNPRTNIIYNQTKEKKNPKRKAKEGKSVRGREDKKAERGSQIGMLGKRRMKDGEGGRGITK